MCCCCGVYVTPGAGEYVIVGINGEDEYMCRRCFNEECDCQDDDVEAIGNAAQFFRSGDWLPSAEK
jgi:hypothetical protein